MKIKCLGSLWGGVPKPVSKAACKKRQEDWKTCRSSRWHGRRGRESSGCTADGEGLSFTGQGNRVEHEGLGQQVQSCKIANDWPFLPKNNNDFLQFNQIFQVSLSSQGQDYVRPCEVYEGTEFFSEVMERQQRFTFLYLLPPSLPQIELIFEWLYN